MIVYANLDAEARWAGVALPAAVARRVSAMAALTAALVDEPAEVWAPAVVDPARLIGVTATMRVGTPPRWDLAWADPDAKHANDRRANLAIAQAAGFALPGARVIASVDEIDRERDAWVCKAPWTTAGRDRVRSHDPDARARVTQLLERCGDLVLEPWLDRVLDVAICGRLAGERVELATPHLLITNRHGGFVGIELDPPPLQPGERDQLVAAAHAAAAGLARAGYAGPFGVDAFVYKVAGERRFHAMCEINARHTFGHVARALDVRRLGFGTPPPGARVVIAPTVDDPLTAWVA